MSSGILGGGVRRIGLWAVMLRNIRLSWRLLRDPRVALLTKLALPAVFVLYMVSPTSLFEAVPVVGQVDDLAVAMLILGLFIRLVPRSIVQEHESALSERAGRPTTVDGQYRVVR